MKRVRGKGRAALRAFMRVDESDDLCYDELPGFLFALACAPETISPSEWLPEVLGEDRAFDDESQMQAVLGELMAWYNEINMGVLDRRPRLPSGCSFDGDVLDAFEPTSPVAAWSRGFLRAHIWLLDDWDEYLPEDEELELEFHTMVFALSFFSSRERAQDAANDDDMPLEELAARVRDVFADSMASYAHVGRSIHEALMDEESEDEDFVDERRPFVAEPSVGRNEPCPCGSGKKHKHCCGKHVH